MRRWLKRILIAIAIAGLMVFCLAAFIRFEGIQYTIAAGGGGYARVLPAPDAFPVTLHGGASPCASSPIKVITYNIFNGSAMVEDLVERFGKGNIKGFKPWSVRVPEIKERVAGYTPDLIGWQEMGWNHDIEDVVPAEGGFTLLTFKLGRFEYGDSAMMFRTVRFDLVDNGQFWYGPHPDLPMAYGFQRLSMLRYCNWCVLREKDSGFTFLWANTHFDNNGRNKEPAAQLFRERISILAQGMPVIATGDFNSTGDTDRYEVFTGADLTPPLLLNAQTLSRRTLVHEAHGAEPRVMTELDRQLHFLNRIDHILVGGPCPVSVDQWMIDTRPMKDGAPISDHDLIAAEVRFGGESVTAEDVTQGDG